MYYAIYVSLYYMSVYANIYQSNIDIEGGKQGIL